MLMLAFTDPRSTEKSNDQNRRGRIGRGGRVIWDRVPVKGALPAREDGLADPDEAALVVHSSYVQFPFKPPSAHVLHPPMVNLKVSVSWLRAMILYGCGVS